MSSIHQLIQEESCKFLGYEPDIISELPITASQRHYFRVKIKTGETFIATYHNVVRENEAFVYLAKQFKKFGVNVPEIYYVSKDLRIYFQQDLGEQTLFSVLTNNFCKENVLSYYRQAIEQLINIQFKCATELDFTKCYPTPEFDTTSIGWDLNYWKYFFLKLSDVPFNEKLLENDFKVILQYFSRASFIRSFFHRDFQSRNIMLYEQKCWIIDFQGGRKGPVLYDLASCILDAKANLTFDMRQQIITYYLDLVKKYTQISYQIAIKHLSACLLLRLLQAFGTYGYRGLVQRMQHFIQSIPYAFQNYDYIIKNYSLPFKVSYLHDLLAQLREKYEFFQTVVSANNQLLEVIIISFSYRKGIPIDTTGHGGGYVFDCRCLPNPGRIPELQKFTGNEQIISHFFEQYSEIEKFLKNAFALINQSIINYIERRFQTLTVAFGCTGGQHRSVYCANIIANMIEKQFNHKVIVRLLHRELLK